MLCFIYLFIFAKNLNSLSILHNTEMSLRFVSAVHENKTIICSVKEGRCKNVKTITIKCPARIAIKMLSFMMFLNFGNYCEYDRTPQLRILTTNN